MSAHRDNGQKLHPYVSTGGAAHILDVTHEAISQDVRKGRLPAIRLGRNWAIPRDALLEFARTYVKGTGRRKPKVQERKQS